MPEISLNWRAAPAEAAYMMGLEGLKGLMPSTSQV